MPQFSPDTASPDTSNIPAGAPNDNSPTGGSSTCPTCGGPTIMTPHGPVSTGSNQSPMTDSQGNEVEPNWFTDLRNAIGLQPQQDQSGNWTVSIRGQQVPVPAPAGDTNTPQAPAPGGRNY